jgi:phosphate transport system substrate-binding protein
VSTKIRTRRATVPALVAACLVANAWALNVGAGTASATASHALIQGSGSSWAANAVNQWIADVQQSGLQVVFTSVGSAQGRKDFGYKTTDFAVSDIGYLGVDPVTGDQDTSFGRAYAYLPIVAGGTAFPYQVRVAGRLVRNIRLSGLTLAKIFTNRITSWGDPAITADNNGRQLPSIPIIPVVHSEGSGSTAQFTRFLAKRFPSLWQSYSGQSTFTEYYPRKGQQIAENGSDGVMNFISSAAANGSIGYDEYSYAKNKDYPVLKIENTAGYFTAPDQYNVAVALTQARINYDQNPAHCAALGYTPPCYLLQNLDGVYVYGDKRTYPMSSYSYMIIPTASNDPRMTTAKRQTLADYLYYSVCEGQAEMGPIGYSPLPINLVQASFQQVGVLKQADPGVDLSQRNVTTCHNPTFVAGQPNRNYLAEIAPQPPPCDRFGAGPCGDNEGIVNTNPTESKVQTSGPSSSAGSSPAAKTTAKSAPGAAVNPLTGQVETIAADDSFVLALGSAEHVRRFGALAVLAAIELLLVLTLPPLMVGGVTRRMKTR